jgi:hypothetical protein
LVGCWSYCGPVGALLKVSYPLLASRSGFAQTRQVVLINI